MGSRVTTSNRQQATGEQRANKVAKRVREQVDKAYVRRRHGAYVKETEEVGDCTHVYVKMEKGVRETDEGCT